MFIVLSICIQYIHKRIVHIGIPLTFPISFFGVAEGSRYKHRGVTHDFEDDLGQT